MWRRRIEQALILALGLLVVAGAALLGGVYPETQVWLSGVAVALFGLAVVFRVSKQGALTLGSPFWVLGAVSLLCLLQLTELPEGMLAWLQPRGTALAAYATEGLGPPFRRCLSLDPPATAVALSGILGLAALAGAAALLLRDGSRALFFLWTVSFGGMALALVAAVQRLSGAEAVFWVYRPLLGNEFVTPFVNSNHAGGFYGALTFLSLGLALQMRERRPRLVGFVLSALPASMVLASASRGAIAATCLGAILLLVLRWRSGALDRRRLLYWVAGVILVGTVALPLSATIRREFGKGTKWEALDEDVKVLVWRDAMALARDYPYAGVGRGAFRTAFPAYQEATEGFSRTVHHPENLFVQWIVELGPILGVGLMLLVAWLAIRYFRRHTIRPLHAVALCPLVVLLLQNTVDFNLEYPGTAFLAASLLGTLAGLSLGRTRRVASPRVRRVRASVLLGLTGLAGLGIVHYGGYGLRFDLMTETSELARRLECQDPPQKILAQAQRTIRRHPADYYVHYLAGAAALRIPGEQPLRYFNRALFLNPRSTLTQFQVGRALQSLGLYHQALGHLLEALRLRLPLQGPFGRTFFHLLQQLWQEGDEARQLQVATACEGGLLGPGQLPLLDCLLAWGGMEVQRARPLARVAAIDPRAARQLALWLEGVQLRSQAMAAWVEIHRARPAELEPLEALTRLAAAERDLAKGEHFARRWVEQSGLPEAFTRLAEIQREGGLGAQAEATVDRGRKRHPETPALLALKAELLLEREQMATARDLLLERLLGPSMDVNDEIRLLRIRIDIERRLGNRMRAARLESRLDELQRMVKAGYRGQILRR